MKHPPNKNQLREEIDQLVSAYLGEGGAIEEVARGATGITGNDFRQQLPSGGQPRQERTPLPEVVAAIEARRAVHRRRQQPRTRLRAPRRKAIYDDFGEPVRWVWTEE